MMIRSMMQTMVVVLSLFMVATMILIGLKDHGLMEKSKDSSMMEKQGMDPVTVQRMERISSQLEGQIISMDRRLERMEGWIDTIERYTNKKDPANIEMCNDDDDDQRKSVTLQEETARLLIETVRMDYKCVDERRWGGGKDKAEGAWTVCMDEMKGKVGCVTYSFGINNDFSFDDESQTETGCEVHSFDPSMGWRDVKRKDGSWFWNTGISGQDLVRDERGWKVQTLKTVMRSLNHTSIDILKMDVEGDEWESLDAMLNDGSFSSVDRLMIEIHFYSTYRSIEVHEGWRRILQRIRSDGMMLHYFRENPMSTSSETGFRNIMSCCFELSFVRGRRRRGRKENIPKNVES